MSNECSELEELERLLEMAPCGIGLFDAATGKRIFLNKAYYDIVGFTPEEYEVNHAVSDIDNILPEDLPAKNISAVQFARDGRAMDYQYRIYRKDRSIIWLKMSADTVHIGDKAYAFTSFTDVTVIKEKEMETALEQRRFQTVISELNAAVFEWNLKDGGFYCSEAYNNYAFSRISNEDILNNSGPMDTVHPDDIDAFKEFFKETTEGKNKVEVVLRLKLITGEFHWCRMMGFYYKDDNGVPDRTVGVIIDINKDRERSFMFNNLLNQMPGGVGIFTFGKRLECQYYSDGFAKLSGRTRDEIDVLINEGCLLETAIAPADYEHVMTMINRQVSKSLPINLTYRYLTIDGEIKWLHLSASKMREAEDGPVYYCVFTNPTDETALYQSIVEDSAIGVFIATRSTRNVMYINNAAKEICGLSHEMEMTGVSLNEYLGKLGKIPLISDEEVKKLKENEYTEMHVTRNALFLAIKVKALTWNGIPSYIMYITDETTEHKHQQELQELVNKVPAGIGIYEIERGTIYRKYLNDAFFEMNGISPEEREQYYMRSAIDSVYPEDWKDMSELVERLYQGNDKDTAYIRIQSSHIWKWMKLDVSVVDRDKKRIRAYAAFSECDAMIKEKNRYRTIMDTLNIALMEWERDKGFYSSEKYNLYALSEQSNENVLTNSADRDVVYPEDWPLLEEFFSNHRQKHSKLSTTLRMKMKDGTYRWTEMLEFNEYDNEGRLSRVIGILRDVEKEWIEQNEKLRSALNEAKRANKAKTEFLSRMSHDIRTPMNAIIGLTQLAESEPDMDTVRSYLENIGSSSDFLLGLINDILDLSKIESGELKLNPEPFALGDFVKSVNTVIKPLMDAKDIEFIFSMNVKETCILVDRLRYNQIFFNLLSNAAKFTPKGGRVEFLAEDISYENGMYGVRYYVRDNGVGMSQEFLPHIFESFSQERTRDNENVKGSGLGLPIVKSLVDAMDGRIYVKSKQNVGTEFVVELYTPVAEAEGADRALDYENYDFKNTRILLVEDNELNVLVARKILEKKGCQVTVADNGQAAIDLFGQSPAGYYNAILMDVRMPVMNGLEATRIIRRLPRPDAEKIPIIAMTADAFAEEQKRTIEAGMNRHLSKPIRPEELYKTLAEYVK